MSDLCLVVIYRQRVHGVTVALVSVGYEHASCLKIIWEHQTTRVAGNDLLISMVGGFNLHVHHTYNYHQGEPLDLQLLCKSLPISQFGSLLTFLVFFSYHSFVCLFTCVIHHSQASSHTFFFRNLNNLVTVINYSCHFLPSLLSFSFLWAHCTSAVWPVTDTHCLSAFCMVLKKTE